MKIQEWGKLHGDKIIAVKTATNISLKTQGIEPATLSMFKLNNEIAYENDGVVELDDGRVWGARGAVMDKDGILIEGLCREFGVGHLYEHTIYSKPILQKAQKIQETVAVIATAGSNVYYHWLFDVLPRIGIIEQAGLKGQIDLWVVDYTNIPFQRDTLSLLGIDNKKLLCCNDNWGFHAQAKRLFVPSLSSGINEISPFACSFLREKFLHPDILDKEPEVGKRIYISRSRTGNRMVVNEEEVLSALTRNYGFEMIFLEELSFRQQVLLFSRAEMVVGPHGSGFGNLVFARCGTLAIDIQPETNIVPCFWVLSTIVGVEYLPLVGQAQPDPNGHKKHDNVWVEVGRVSAAVDHYIKNKCLKPA